MTETLDKLASKTEEILKQEAFDSLSSLFIENYLTSQELIIFYKRKDFILSNIKYWQSSLPSFHIETLLESDLKVSWLYSYFSNDQFCNDMLNQKLLLIIPNEFVRFLKFTHAFNKPQFWESLNFCKHKFPRLETLTKELFVIRQKLNEIKQDNEEESAILKHLLSIDLIIAFTNFYHFFKRQPNVMGNNAFQTEVEVALIEELNRVIPISNCNDSTTLFPFKTNEELQGFLEVKIKNIAEDKPMLFLFKIIEKMIHRKSLNGRIDMYCCGYADFIDYENAPFILKTNEAQSVFNFNNKKSQPEEYYLNDFSFEKSIQYIQDIRISGESEIKHFDYYGIPASIKSDNKSIDLTKAFKLLKHFSVYKGPQEPSNTAPNAFKSVFGGNELLSLFDYNQLLSDIALFFNWKKEECEDLLQFLSVNLSQINHRKKWLANPFLKFGDKILWIGSFLRDRRWENIILNKIKTEKQLEKNIKPISKNLELNTINLFKKAGFKAFGISSFKTNNGKSGDIDVIAYKNGCLVIAEVKSGNRSDDYSHATYSELIRLEGSAAEQLAKIEEYIKEDWESIKKENGIQTPKPFEKITIYPLIITDYYEGDLGLYKQKYSKTSLLELDVIISNSKERLLKTYHKIQFFSNTNNSYFNQKPVKFNFDLWNGKALSAELLINKIEGNEVWKEIESIWNLTPFEYDLS
jgi:hypothetical protein